MTDDRPPFYHPPPPGVTEAEFCQELTVRWLQDALEAAQQFGAPADVVARIEAARDAAQRWVAEAPVIPAAEPRVEDHPLSAAEAAQRIVEAHAAYWRARGCEVHVEPGRCVVIHPSRQAPEA